MDPQLEKLAPNQGARAPGEDQVPKIREGSSSHQHGFFTGAIYISTTKDSILAVRETLDPGKQKRVWERGMLKVLFTCRRFPVPATSPNSISLS
jgi:hypothetical protein